MAFRKRKRHLESETRDPGPSSGPERFVCTGGVWPLSLCFLICRVEKRPLVTAPRLCKGRRVATCGARLGLRVWVVANPRTLPRVPPVIGFWNVALQGASEIQDKRCYHRARLRSLIHRHYQGPRLSGLGGRMARGPQGAQSCPRPAALLRDSRPPCGVLLHRVAAQRLEGSPAFQGGPAVDARRRRPDNTLVSFSVGRSCLSLTPRVVMLMSRPGLSDEPASYPVGGRITAPS